LASKITVFIVDDHAVVRQGLKAGLEIGGDIAVVGEADHGREAIRKVLDVKPNVVLLDLAMPIMNGIETGERLAEVLPDCKVVIWSSYTDPYEVLRALDAGAAGYVGKDGTISEVLRAVRAVGRGSAYFSAAIARSLLQLMRRELDFAEHLGPESAELTRREKQMLQLLGLGKTNEQIAAELGISAKTAEKHCGSLMHKLSIRERATLTRHAVDSGVVPVKGPALANDYCGGPKPPTPATNQQLPSREELKQTLRKNREQAAKLRQEMQTLRAKMDQLFAESKDVKKQIPFRRT
jgi:DNA-binding NarL/FixJ family response regulator